MVQGDRLRDRPEPPSLSQQPPLSSATVSLDTSRATSRSVEVRLVKLRQDILHYRSSSVEPNTQEAEGDGDSADADPDWEENEEEDGKDEVGDDDPEYDPEKRERGKKTV